MSTYNHKGYESNGHRIARPCSKHPNTEHWSAIRNAALERDRHGCRTCWRTAKDGYALECHHRHYDNWGAEELDDVVMLCIRCHDLHTSDVRLARHAASPPIPLDQVSRSPDSYVPLMRSEIGVTPHREAIAVFVPARKKLRF